MALEFHTHVKIKVEPVDPYDVVNKRYVDQFAGAGSGYSPSGDVVGATPSDALPLMDDVAAPGTLTAYSRGDHVHPAGVVEFSRPAGNVWNLPHNLNSRYVSVQVVDNSGNTVLGDVNFVDANNLTITFGNPKAGFARIRK